MEISNRLRSDSNQTDPSAQTEMEEFIADTHRMSEIRTSVRLETKRSVFHKIWDILLGTAYYKRI
jgi:hypothetical protein